MKDFEREYLVRDFEEEYLLNITPTNLDETVSAMSPEHRRLAVIALESVALAIVQRAAYINMRYGAGCGDQGHKAAVKAFNRAGKKVWVGVFGYSAYRDLRF